MLNEMTGDREQNSNVNKRLLFTGQECAQTAYSVRT